MKPTHSTSPTLRYHAPATNWENEALPIGNGRLGAMLFGGVWEERVQFNEQSLWSGDNNWDGEYQTGDHGFGAYRTFGDLFVSLMGVDAPTDYRRELNLGTGVHVTTFVSGGTTFTREAFASRPDQAIVLRFTASKRGALTGKIRLTSGQGATVQARGKELFFEGAMPNGLQHAALLRAQNAGGKLSADGPALAFSGCDSLTLLLNARTNYAPDYKRGWRGESPMPRLMRELDSAGRKSYPSLKSAHVKDLGGLLGRAALDLGKTEPNVSSKPTDERLKLYAKGGVDPELEVALFQYGRYLLASCSRPGGLPANLQGLWNESNHPAWASDYHNNINVQMNYWAAETTNLSECHVPLIDYIVAQAEPCRLATRKAFGAKTRGWTARTSQNIFGGNGWEWNIPASAWYAQHAWERFAFTQNREYLKSIGYPILKEICEFWEDRLKALPDGTLVAPDGWSPEHGPREDGVMMDQQLIWDLFQNYLDAGAALGIDAAYQAKIRAMQARLAPNKIGKWGQLQEWQTDRDDPKDTHRHTSHLLAVYPGRQISLSKTPELAAAAVKSLKARCNDHEAETGKPFAVETTIGDSRRSWTWPWRAALWARLGEPERAYISVRGLLTYNTLPNLFANHPPFQLDGNFGISGAIAELLLQSHAETIEILPALPSAWAKSGAFTGLKARGNLTIDCAWQNGKVTALSVTSPQPQTVSVRVNGAIRKMTARLRK